MFNLGQYLHQLLLTHPQVGLPGIGIFSKERIPARYDEQIAQFLPPTSVYSLIPHAAVDDCLVDYVAKSLHLSYEEAIDAVDKAVDRLLTTINEHGEARLEPIGYLKEVAGVYTLVSKEDPSFWGLQPVDDYKEVSEPEASRLVSEQEETIPQEASPTVEEVQPEIRFEETISNEKEPSNNTWLWLLSGIILIGVIGFFVWKRQDAAAPNKHNQTETNTASANADSLSNAAAADTNSHAIRDTTKVAQPTDTLKQPTAVQQEEPLVRKASKEKPFCIVIGSFKTMKLAIEQAKYFRTIGIEAFVLESNMPNNRKKICYGSYPTKEAAKVHLEKVRNEITKEAYIYP